MSKTWKKPESNEDKRLNVLFSPFRKREFNPIDYDSKLNYWKEEIDKLCRKSQNATFTVTKLQREFTRNKKSPSCIPTVVEELLRSGDAMLLDSFLKINPSLSWGGWVVSSLIVTPTVWSFKKLLEALDYGKDNEQCYVSIQYLKALGGDIVQKCERESTYVMTKENFIKGAFHYREVPNETVDLLVRYLMIEKKCLVLKTDGKEFLKIGSQVKDFTESETVFALLEDNRKHLEHTIETLEKEKNDCMDLVRKQLKDGNKILAKNTLRKCKELEKFIQKKCSTLMNLDSLITRIHEIKSDSEILKAYKLGLSALKNNLKQGELDENSVDETMSEIQEVTEMHEDIQSILSLPITPNDDSKLEEELSEILASDIPEKEDSIEIDLPSVPISPLANKEKFTNKGLIFEPVGL
ncbi:charged multivesicular body protein 7 [Cimex lectularius]|uniref:Charged multivesicular body protein 7 n=1 Tax=Cimex lectularius TaxID=79782 RepID=A0A8I6RRU3_CIMLE|nr:charged multivesicular body protein 7 [Cimex lectularius]